MNKPCVDRPTFWIFGAGHVGTELAAVAAEAGFNVAVVDSRADWADASRFPNIVAVHDAEPVDFIRAGHLTADDWVVVMTHSHPLDEEIIRQLLPMSLTFLGMIGSRGKWARFVQRFRARGIPRTRSVRSTALLDSTSERKPQQKSLSALQLNVFKFDGVDPSGHLGM